MKSSPNWAQVLVAIAGVVVAIVAVLGFLCSKRTSNKGGKGGVVAFIFQRYGGVIGTGTITLLVTILIFSSIKGLPDAKTVTQMGRTVGSELAGMNKNMALFSKGMDNIIHTIIRYQKEPEAARNRVYEDALKQAAAKGYVFCIPRRDYFITEINKRGDEHLLTKKERKRIKNSLDEILKRTNKRDQISLMSMVLSDIRVTEELWKPKERKVELSELDIIGVVGGYIGEVVLKY